MKTTPWVETALAQVRTPSGLDHLFREWLVGYDVGDNTTGKTIAEAKGMELSKERAARSTLLDPTAVLRARGCRTGTTSTMAGQDTAREIAARSP